MPLLLAAAIASLVSWVPMRWPTADPASLALLSDTPVNCLLLEQKHWSPALTAAAREKGIAVVGVVNAAWDGEAAMCGARWVIALDDDLQKRLLAGDANAVRDWRKLAAYLTFLEAHNAELRWPPTGQLTLIQDERSGALLSGGFWT